MHISRHDRIYQTLANIFLIILVVVIILPFLLLFISSITEEGTLVRDGCLAGDRGLRTSSGKSGWASDKGNHASPCNNGLHKPGISEADRTDAG